MLPQAVTVMTRVPPITRSALVLDVLKSLKEHAVAVLVDEDRRPIDILTSCDVEAVKQKVSARKLAGNSPAHELFTEQGREVYTVREGDSLDVVAQKLARFGLGTGIAVVDASGRYSGYVYNREMRRRASEYSQQVEADVRRVEAEFPEAWSSLQRRPPSS
jgi:CBS domain-containing protein